MEGKLLQLFPEDHAIDVEHFLEDKALTKRFRNEKYILIHQREEDDTLRFHSGKKLSIGELTYLQKMLNIQIDNILLSYD